MDRKGKVRRVGRRGEQKGGGEATRPSHGAAVQKAPLQMGQSWFQSQFRGRLCEIWFLSWDGQQLARGFPEGVLVPQLGARLTVVSAEARGLSEASNLAETALTSNLNLASKSTLTQI